MQIFICIGVFLNYLVMDANKPRIIKDFEKLSIEIQEQIKL